MQTTRPSPQREYYLYGTKMYLASGTRLIQHKSCTGAECPTPTHAINGNHRPNDSATTQSHHLCTAQTVPRTKQIACCLSLRLRSPSHFSCSLQRAMVLRLQPGKLCRWSKAFRHWQRRVTWTTKERGSGTERPVRARQLSYYMEAWRAA